MKKVIFCCIIIFTLASCWEKSSITRGVYIGENQLDSMFISFKIKVIDKRTVSIIVHKENRNNFYAITYGPFNIRGTLKDRINSYVTKSKMLDSVFDFHHYSMLITKVGMTVHDTEIYYALMKPHSFLDYTVSLTLSPLDSFPDRLYYSEKYMLVDSLSENNFWRLVNNDGIKDSLRFYEQSKQVLIPIKFLR